MNSLTRFTAAAQKYSLYRPGYPDSLFHFLHHECPPLSSSVVELGGGTGIFTRRLLQDYKRVIAVEPNAAMAALATGIPMVCGTAEHTGLPADLNCDLVVAAQAGHWFDWTKAMREMRRISKPQGFCAMIWNDRRPVGFNVELERVLRERSETYGNMPRPGSTIELLKELVPHGKEVVFMNEQRELELEEVLGRMWSVSYVVHGVRDRKAFDGDLAKAFEKCKNPQSGKVAMAYDTRVFCWRFLE